MMAINPMYSLAGLAVGILVGLTGVGGGSLMTPLLVLAFGFHPAVAVGTDLLYASVTKTVGSMVHGWQGAVDWRILRLLAYGSMPAALAMLLLLSYVGRPSEAIAQPIAIALGVMLVLTGTALLFRNRIVLWSRAHLKERSERQTAIMTVVLGVVVGAAVSLTSVGAGAIGATALLILYPRVPLNRIVGTDIAHAVPLTLLSGIGHLLLGTVDVPLLGSLLLGSVPGIIIGSMMASRVREHHLRPILAVVLILVGVNMVV
jgi:uncharacterized membrane protein YfcA